MTLMDRLREPRAAALIGIALAVAIGAFLLLRGDDDDSSGPEPTNGAEAASVEDLQTIADAADHPVYWAGEQEGQQYELTITAEGNIFIRYLDPSTPIGSADIASLTIGTYPVPDAYNALQGLADQKGSITDTTPDGGYVLTNKNNPNSVYVAFPGEDFEVEVYDPDPKKAREVATSGAIVPIE
jgi:hypothetical protein